jgi:hypothetical protein
MYIFKASMIFKNIMLKSLIFSFNDLSYEDDLKNKKFHI